MIIADQWIAIQSAEVRRQSDTTQFYEPIFNKYGYTLSDYLTSVDYYMNDPERFSRILKKTQSILEAGKAKDEAILGVAQEEEESAVEEDMSYDEAEAGAASEDRIPAPRRESRRMKKKQGSL